LKDPIKVSVGLKKFPGRDPCHAATDKTQGPAAQILGELDLQGNNIIPAQDFEECSEGSIPLVLLRPTQTCIMAHTKAEGAKKVAKDVVQLPLLEWI
jgi:hypothetical protein